TKVTPTPPPGLSLAPPLQDLTPDEIGVVTFELQDLSLNPVNSKSSLDEEEFPFHHDPIQPKPKPPVTPLMKVKVNVHPLRCPAPSPPHAVVEMQQDKMEVDGKEDELEKA